MTALLLVFLHREFLVTHIVKKISTSQDIVVKMALLFTFCCNS